MVLILLTQKAMASKKMRFLRFGGRRDHDQRTLRKCCRETELLKPTAVIQFSKPNDRSVPHLTC